MALQLPYLTPRTGPEPRTFQPWIFPVTMAALALLVFAAACGSADDGSAQHGLGEDFDPQPIMRQAVGQLLALESAEFTLEHLAGTTTLLPGLEMTKAYGVVEIPSKFTVTVEAQLGSPHSYVEIAVVTIDDTAYMTDILSGKWRQVSPDSLPFNVFGLGETLAAVVDSVRDPELVSVDELRGTETYRIRGNIKSQDLASLVPGAGTGFDVGLELWLDRDAGLLHQVLINGKVVPTDVDEAVRRLTLDDINVPVNITAPN
jgi:hypothetical protein